MKEEDYKLVTLVDDTKWLVVAQTVYDEAEYQYFVGVNENEDEILEEYKVMRVYHKDNQNYYDEVKDADILKIVVPLLIPEAAEYIKNPDKLKELTQN